MEYWQYILIGVIAGIILVPLLLWAGWKIFLLLLRSKFKGLAEALQGLQGLAQYSGLSYRFDYSTNSVPSTDPGANNVKTNSSIASSVTIITIDDTALNGGSLDNLYDYLDTEFSGNPIRRLSTKMDIITNLRSNAYKCNNLRGDFC